MSQMAAWVLAVIFAGGTMAGGYGLLRFLPSQPTLASSKTDEPHGTAHAPEHSSTHKVSHWTYEGEGGPSEWASIGEENQACGIGKIQSPINLDGHVIASSGELPEFHYGQSELKWKNNGHTLQADVQGDNFVQMGNKKFNLLQFHFHTPSEHLLKSKHFPLEMHMVHRSEDGELAVLGWFVEEGPDQLFKTFWHDLPSTEGESSAHEMHINLEKFSPVGQTLLTYQGSLTTPPCSEGVNWMVAKAPIAMNRNQISEFQNLFPMNARPAQEIGDRHLQSFTPGYLSH